MDFNHTDKIVPQSGVIAWRGQGSSLEVVLVTSRSRKRWVIPKGGLEPDMTPAESAANEAWEEAGLLGRVSEQPLGCYGYVKMGLLHRVEVYSLQVAQVLEQWLEMHQRSRRWVSPQAAADLVHEEGLKAILRSLNEAIGVGE